MRDWGYLPEPTELEVMRSAELPWWEYWAQQEIDCGNDAESIAEKSEKSR